MSLLYGSGLAPPIPYPTRAKPSNKRGIIDGNHRGAGVIQPNGGQLSKDQFSDDSGEGRGYVNHDDLGKGLAT